jgi:nickel/cobalt transporter (NicO) family protein
MQDTTISLMAATFFIALTHSIMPTHWMPFALIGREQKWGLTKVIFVTAISGLGHSMITSVLGSVVALFGFHIAEYAEAFAEPVSGSVLIVIGITFIVVGRLKPKKHNHDHSKLSDKAIIISLFLMLSCSPCVALLPIFLAAGTFNWSMLFLLAIILSVTTVSGMLGLTILTYKGIKKINICKIEPYEKEIVGGLLTTAGILFLILHR